MRNLYLVFHGRFPGERAAALFVKESAAAFSSIGASVTVVSPRRLGRGAAGELTYDVVYLPTLDLYWLPVPRALAFYASLGVFSIVTFFYLLFAARKTGTIYSTDSLPLLLASTFTKSTCYELHDYPERSSGYWRMFFKRVGRILVTNELKMTRLSREYPEATPKAFVEQNAVALNEFSVSITRAEARKRLKLPQNAKIALYTGHLYGWKGADTFALAAGDHAEIEVYFVGGTDKDRAAFARYTASAANIHLVGWRPHEEIPLWQKAADVLVLPNTARDAISRESTSPMKLFEYMASGTPIVASDLPSIREIAGEGRAILVTPDDPNALAKGIQEALQSGGDAPRRAFEWVREHTWDKRAARILDSI